MCVRCRMVGAMRHCSVDTKKIMPLTFDRISLPAVCLEPVRLPSCGPCGHIFCKVPAQAPPKTCGAGLQSDICWVCCFSFPG